VGDVPEGELAAIKRDQRRAAKAGRHAAASAAPVDAATLAAKHFLAHIPLRSGQAIAGYWPVGDEFDPRPILLAALDRGLVVGLPVVTARHMPLTFRCWRSGEAMAPGVMNIPVPTAASPAVVPDLLIVPLLAFDGSGYRLGYGAGHYDRTLAELRRGERPVLAVGLAYAGQEQAQVPHNAFDQPLDWVVTEREARKLR
jgi:5-formyltetrahydrofolate cyclo-ligase